MKKPVQYALVHFNNDGVHAPYCYIPAMGKRRRSKRRAASYRDDPRWQELRALVFKAYGKKCMKCGSYHKPNVDHIKPKSKYPELTYEFNNLQVLCWRCNRTKNYRDETDYRGRS